MDTLILLALLAAVLLFRFTPNRIWGLLLLLLAWVSVCAVFLYHSTSTLNLNF